MERVKSRSEYDVEDECIDDQDTNIWYKVFVKEENFMNILCLLILFNMLLWHTITNSKFW